MVVGFVFMKPILFAFGASDASFVYAKEYLSIYLCGTFFSAISTGMNGYINAQGFPKTGMLTIVIGAVCNIILDPIFIFKFNMGVSGAALATVISQAISAVWVLIFITGKKAPIPVRRQNMTVRKEIVKDICKLGTASFMVQGTNCLVQIVCNSTLQIFGGDIYVGIMTVINSVREIFSLPVIGITHGAQPVVSFNYGAKRYERVLYGIRFTTIIGVVYTMLAWILVLIFPQFWFGLFSDDTTLIISGIEAMGIYFFGFVFMALQFAGQTTFQELGDAKHAIFFSILRKVIIVVPLSLLLPRMGFGVLGVFLAEPISNVVGGLACFLTMRFTIYKKIEKEIKKNKN